MPSSLPSVVERRALLFGKESMKADHKALAEKYFEAGRLLDALEFFFMANHEAGIDRIRQKAIESGDTFLLDQIERVTRNEESLDSWRKAAVAAEKKGKLAFALHAYEKVGDTGAVTRLGGGEPEEEDS